jgi:antitoxin (DNA-binding transcriptional repressor) of toxin-antitoxin stability system
MTIQIEVAELGPRGKALVDDLAENGGETCLTRDGKMIAKVIPADAVPISDTPRRAGLVLYKGEWMIPAAVERERSIEHL